MLYLLDANVLIDANRDYYGINRVPEFWDWLIYQGQNGRVKIPMEVYEEVKDGKDELAVWSKLTIVKDELLFTEEAEASLVSRITDEGYGPNLTDDEIVKLGRDPFLIGYALADPPNRSIVTTEVSKPSRIGSNRHIPDVCAEFGIGCVNTFQLLRALDFKTGWNKS